MSPARRENGGDRDRIGSVRRARPPILKGARTMVHARVRLLAAAAVSPVIAVLFACPAGAKTINYVPQTVDFTYCFSHPPAARIASGDTGTTNTRASPK